MPVGVAQIAKAEICKILTDVSSTTVEAVLGATAKSSIKLFDWFFFHILFVIRQTISLNKNNNEYYF